MENYVIEKRADGSVSITGKLFSDLEYLDCDDGFSTVISKESIQKICETAEFVTSKGLFEASFFHPVESGKIDEDTGEIDFDYGYNSGDAYAETSCGYVLVDRTTFQLMLSLKYHAEDLRSETISISEIM